MRLFDAGDGAVVRETPLPPEIFGEGLTVVGEEVALRSRRVFFGSSELRYVTLMSGCFR